MASGDLILGIDIGTSATKLVVLDPSKGVVGVHSEATGAAARHPGWAEADPAAWWDSIRRGVPAALHVADVGPDRIGAVGVCGMVPTMALLDSNGEVLRPSIQQNDARATREIEEFRSEHDLGLVLTKTGSSISAQSIGPKFRWIQRHEPEIAKRVTRIVGSYDFVVGRLTGQPSIERNWALESGLWDMTTDSWDAAMLESSGVEASWLAPVHRSTDVVGGVSAEAASATGLLVDTPVVAGSADHVASALAAGVVYPGNVLIKLGSSGDVLACSAEPIVDPRLFLDHHVVPGLWLPNGCMAASGTIVTWFADEIGGTLSLAALDAEAAVIAPGSDGILFLPYMLGEKTPLHDPFARGTWIGMSLSTKRAHLFRAVLEGISFGFRHHLAVLADCGLTVDRVRCSNGGARSALWKQVTSDVTGLELEVLHANPGSSLGAAMVAGIGSGLIPDWDAAQALVRVASTVRPDRTAHERYEGIFPLYQDAYARLRTLYPVLEARTR